jgi:hypothetical protein
MNAMPQASFPPKPYTIVIRTIEFSEADNEKMPSHAAIRQSGKITKERMRKDSVNAKLIFHSYLPFI